MDILFTLGVTLFLLILGFGAGTFAEKRHFNRLAERESENIQMLQTQSKIFLSPKPGGKAPMLVHSEMVVASDYFKNFLSNIRKFFGGEMRSYHSLMERARREAWPRSSNRRGRKATTQSAMSGSNLPTLPVLFTGRKPQSWFVLLRPRRPMRQRWLQLQSPAPCHRSSRDKDHPL